ncbi:MAG: SDR family oxidoreductase [Alphaproteobacteria bacterium]|nr:SDR family oxidoreductase [Alphaproteobacteria bacterium]
MSGPLSVVTGGASGIGRAVVDSLLRAGRPALILDRDAAALDAALAAAPPDADLAGAAVDISDAAQVARALEEALDGRPVCALVNNAGVAIERPFRETSVELFRAMLDVNVLGAVITAQTCLPLLERNGGGAIVNVASVSGLRGNYGRAAYGASKGALLTLTQVMATELAAENIRVNAVCPGPVETPLVKSVHTASATDQWRRLTPQGRYAAPQEIADAILWLLSEQASFVTGAALAVDGGFLSAGLRGAVDAA